MQRRVCRKLLECVGWVLCVSACPLHGQAVTTIQQTGDPSKRLDIAIVGDGYTNAELGKFASDVAVFINGVFAQDPFHEYQSYFNVRRLDVASAESGADHPER